MRILKTHKSLVLLFTISGILLSLLFIALFFPAIKSLWNENELYNELVEFGKSPTLFELQDNQIRQKAQGIARTHGLHLEFEDILVKYMLSGRENTMPPPAQIGYTLPIKIPLFFGALERTIIVCRSFAIPTRGK